MGAASTSLQNQTKQRSHCTKPAKTSCAGCQKPPAPSLAINHISPIYYCSQACQTAGWPSHERTCKTSNTLYRIADTIQKCFLIYREKTFEKKIIKIEEKNGMLYLTEGIYNADEIFVQFPGNLVKNEKDRQAVLTHLACGEVAFWMEAFIKMILEGFNAHLEEVTCKAKNHDRSTEVINIAGTKSTDSRTFDHEFIRITLPTKEVFVLDIASAQNGYYDPISPWDENCEKLIDYVKRIDPYGTCRSYLLGIIATTRIPTGSTNDWSVDELSAEQLRQNLGFMDILGSGVYDWLGKQGWNNFDPLLQMTSESFDTKPEEFLSFVEEKLQTYKNTLIMNGDLGKEYKRAYQKQQQAMLDNEPKATPEKVKKEGKLSKNVVEEMVGKLDISKAEKEGEASRGVMTESHGRPSGLEAKQEENRPDDVKEKPAKESADRKRRGKKRGKGKGKQQTNPTNKPIDDSTAPNTRKIIPLSNDSENSYCEAKPENEQYQHHNTPSVKSRFQHLIHRYLP